MTKCCITGNKKWFTKQFKNIETLLIHWRNQMIIITVVAEMLSHISKHWPGGKATRGNSAAYNAPECLERMHPGPIPS